MCENVHFQLKQLWISGSAVRTRIGIWIWIRIWIRFTASHLPETFANKKLINHPDQHHQNGGFHGFITRAC